MASQHPTSHVWSSPQTPSTTSRSRSRTRMASQHPTERLVLPVTGKTITLSRVLGYHRQRRGSSPGRGWHPSTQPLRVAESSDTIDDVGAQVQDADGVPAPN